MGGKALGYESRRVTTKEVLDITSFMKDTFAEFNPKLVEFFRQKEDHGDVDFVLLGDYGAIRDAVHQRLNPPAEYDNKPVLSFDYNGVQIDFTATRTSEQQQAQLYYMAWNDLGNFIGRVARSINFKYGQDGLTYPLRISDHWSMDIPVSDDMPRVLEFLGYDSKRWEEGFDTREDIFEYAMQTPLFNALYFSLDFQTHQDRVRNKKRKMYQGMMEYLAQKGVQEKPKLTQEERDEHIIRASEHFNIDLRRMIQEQKELYVTREILKTKYNGDLVREWTGLAGKELGTVVSGYKSHVGSEAWEGYLTEQDADQIRSDFLTWYSSCSTHSGNTGPTS